LGFTNDEIIFVDLKEFEKDENSRPKFSAATQKAMKNFARHIFEDT
jgi:hypothetical protein